MTQPTRKVFVAVDTYDMGTAQRLARAVQGEVAGVKLGLEFYMAQGRDGVSKIIGHGMPVFLDLKFHDIPNTVAGALAAVATLGPMIVNLHASGGKQMLLAGANAAREAASRAGRTPPKVIAVTVLTSMDDADLAAVGQSGTGQDQVRRLAQLTRESGLDGVVCSPREISVLRRDQGEDFLLVTPGVRPTWSQTDDQKRVMTPGEAARAGADYLVIGRPISGAPDPTAAARRINAEIEAALA